MQIASKHLKETTRSLFTDAYQKAASAFSSFSGIKISIDLEETTVNRTEAILQNFANEQVSAILLTEIIGDAKGRSYLILNDHETQLLTAAMCTKLKKSPAVSDIHEIVLKEIDNILAATVISQLSSYLNLQIYGDIPHLLSAGKNCIEILNDNLSKCSYQTAIASAVRFRSEEDNRFQPRFIWLLDENFYKKIDHISSSR